MKEKYKVLDLFSGLGGFSLGLERTGHFRTVAFCDNNKFSKAILDKHWKGIKIYDDVREITKERLQADGIEFPDIVTGGFPCQPFSVAGQQKGTSDDRHLWPEMFRIIKAFKPRFVIGENVRGIVNIQDGVVFETVCTNLEDEGYEIQPFNIPAAGVGAPHRRERIWFIAVREESVVDTNNIRFKQHNETEKTTSWRGTSATSESTSDVANTISNNEGQKICRSDEEKREIQEEHRTEHSTTRKSSRTSAIRNGDNGYENVADTENRRGQPSQSERWQGTERGSIDRGGIEREGQDLGSTTDRINVADTNDEGVRTRIGRSDNDHETESGSGGTDRARGSSDVERNNSTSTEIKTMDVADTNKSRSGERKISRNFSDEGRRTGEARREGLQSKDRQTRTNNIGSGNSNVADTESFRAGKIRYSDQKEGSEGSSTTQLDGSRGDVADTNSERLQRTEQFETHRGETETQFSTTQSFETKRNHWEFEPDVGRVAHGISGRVHRLKGLGNSIVPQIVEEIGKAIIRAEQE